MLAAAGARGQRHQPAALAAMVLVAALVPPVARCIAARPGQDARSALVGAALAGLWLFGHVASTGWLLAYTSRWRSGFLLAGTGAAAIDHVLRWHTPFGPTGATAALIHVDQVGHLTLPWFGASGLTGLLVAGATLAGSRAHAVPARVAGLVLVVALALPAPSWTTDGPGIRLHGLRPPADLGNVPSSNHLSLWAQRIRHAPDADWLLVPEGALPNVAIDGARLERLRDAATARTLFVGAAAVERATGLRRNRLVVVPPTGPAIVYGKRTPFPVIEGIVPETLGPAVADVDSVAARLSLCFEGSLVDPAPSADVHVNLASDAWLVDSPFARLHASMVVVRALELSLPTVRHSDVGPSVVVDAAGVRWHPQGAPLVDTVQPRVRRPARLAAPAAPR
jgi:hypothetical protein